MDHKSKMKHFQPTLETCRAPRLHCTLEKVVPNPNCTIGEGLKELVQNTVLSGQLKAIWAMNLNFSPRKPVLGLSVAEPVNNLIAETEVKIHPTPLQLPCGSTLAHWRLLLQFPPSVSVSCTCSFLITIIFCPSVFLLIFAS